MPDRRPTLSSRQTASTLLSQNSYASSSDHPAPSTALTTPDLSSPKKQMGTLEPMLEVFEEASRHGSTSTTTTTIARDVDVVIRGPSVRARASQFEQQQNQQQTSHASSSRLPPARLPIADTGTRSISPKRNSRPLPSPHTPSAVRRVPVPSTAPSRATYNYGEEPVSPSPKRRRSPEKLNRGLGSTKRMVQQWEGIPSNTPPAPGPQPLSDRKRVVSQQISKEYLDHKPLPLPRAGPISTPSYASPGKGYPSSPSRNSYGASPTRNSYGASPSRNSYAPSPLQHLQTPHRNTSSSMSGSPSSWSISPSGEKRRKGGGKSPLKDMLNVFGDGIQALGRKAKGKNKDKDKVWQKNEFHMSVDGGLDRMGSNGLPGGIVFHDRMGDQEMEPKGQSDPNVIRTSAVMYLIPTPCSSLSPWGSWLTSWATLTSMNLRITYCPVFQDPHNGQNTPKRVFSGSTNPNKNLEPAVSFASIPSPEAGVAPDVEMSMKDCVEVRSLRREEIKGRGVPAVPEGVGTEVLEMVWSDGSKRYIGVDGVAGRLGWVSAIWDVLLACKSANPPALPPPSPLASPRPNSTRPMSPMSMGNPSYPSALYMPEGGADFHQNRIPSNGTLAPGPSSAPPVQKIGDRWVAASVLGASDLGSTKQRGDPTSADDLRSSVQRMFDAGPDSPVSPIEQHQAPPTPTPALSLASEGRKSLTEDRIKAWQPVTERDLSIFSRANSRRSETGPKPATYSEIDRVNGYPRTETTLSFDPNDLNPSRSASQVKRNPLESRKVNNVNTNGLGDLTVVEEKSDTTPPETVYPAPTYISHVTFPKPSVGGLAVAPTTTALGMGTKGQQLEMIPSATNSSVETADSGQLRTPETAQTSFASHSSLDHTVLAKLDGHTTEHGSLSKQVDNVQVDLRHVIKSLTTLVTNTKKLGGPDEDLPVPRLLDGRLDTIQMDVKAIENALNLSNLSTARLDARGIATGQEDEKLVEVNTKLDNIAKLCEDLLSKSNTNTPMAMAGLAAVDRANSAATIKQEEITGAKSPAAGSNPSKGRLGIVVDKEDVSSAGEEVAQIMAELTGGSSKNSPRLGGLQVLHNSAPASPRTSAPSSPTLAQGITDDTKKQVGEVLGLVKELKEARTLQTQQTTDIARYLNELNSWLEKFVHNSTSEISSMSKRLTAIVGSDPDAPTEGEKAIGMPDLVADMHSMLTEQKQSAIGQRLDGLLQMMGQEQERHSSQSSMVEQVLGILERQRSDNEMLLRALATDLTTEIRGERLRFVEAMQQATSMNIQVHVEEFKKLLSTEVHKSMKELGQLREERKALEHQISDLFALKAKFGGKDSRKPSAAVVAGPGRGGPPPVPPHGFVPSSPGYGRGLPTTPGR